IHSKTVELKKQLDESDEEILTFAILQLRDQVKSENPVILTPIEIDLPLEGVQLTVPKIGDKKNLVDLSLKNALELKRERLKLKKDASSRTREVLQILQQDMQLPDLPEVIECFDNSNLQGSNPVASMVRFVGAKPDKKNYRHFNIKTVQGPDDFASMKEIVGRRYKRILEENAALPNLILVDGGKGQ